MNDPKAKEGKADPMMAGFIAFLSMTAMFLPMILITFCYCGNLTIPVPYRRFDITKGIIAEQVAKEKPERVLIPKPGLEAGVESIEMSNIQQN